MARQRTEHREMEEGRERWRKKRGESETPRATDSSPQALDLIKAFLARYYETRPEVSDGKPFNAYAFSRCLGLFPPSLLLSVLPFLRFDPSLCCRLCFRPLSALLTSSPSHSFLLSFSSRFSSSHFAVSFALSSLTPPFPSATSATPWFALSWQPRSSGVGRTNPLAGSI